VDERGGFVIFELCWTLIVWGKNWIFLVCATAIFNIVDKDITMQFKFSQGSVASGCR